MVINFRSKSVQFRFQTASECTYAFPSSKLFWSEDTKSHPVWRFGFMWWPSYAGVVRRRSFIRHKVRQSYTSRTVWSRIRCQSFKNCPKMPPPTALGRILENGLSKNYPEQSIGCTNWPCMKSLTGSCRLQNTITYCTKVRKTGMTNQTVK